MLADENLFEPVIDYLKSMGHDVGSIRDLGLSGIVKELGPIGMARFLQQFETSSGDYTKERQSWLKGEDVKSIVKEIKKRRMKS